MRRIAVLLLLSSGLVLWAQDSVPSNPPKSPESISREVLEKRMSDLKAQYDQVVANANALQGAIQDCQYWLDQLKASEPQKNSDKKK